MSPPTVSVASIPLSPSIRNCTAAPGAWPPGTMSEMALPASWAVTTGNQALVRRAMRWRAKVQAKWAPSAKRAGMNQSRLSFTMLGHEWRTPMSSGATTYRAAPAMTITIERLTTAFHGKGRCCSFSKRSSNDPGRGCLGSVSPGWNPDCSRASFGWTGSVGSFGPLIGDTHPLAGPLAGSRLRCARRPVGDLSPRRLRHRRRRT